MSKVITASSISLRKGKTKNETIVTIDGRENIAKGVFAQSVPPKIRKFVYWLYSYRCHICSKEQGLGIHHKDGNRRNQNLYNLELLCPDCHKLQPYHPVLEFS